MVATTEQINLHTLLSNLFLLQSIPTYLLLRYIIIAPFGRHVSKQTNRWWFGPLLNAKLSWFLFEIPNLFWVWYCYCHWCDPDIFYLDSPLDQKQRKVISIEGDNNIQISTNAILLLLFTLHYINRAIIYPIRMNTNSQRVPFIISFCAAIITCWNGYIQSFYLVQVQSFSPISLSLSSILDNIQCWIGICIFFIGMGINIKSDSVLRNLRKDNQQKKKEQKQEDTTAIDNQHKYYIPFSPLFTYISCPNHAGEILEWFGFSIASNFSLPTIAFFIYSSSNLIPRAFAHHEWYKNKFDDYPKERRWAVIPFVV